MGTTLFSKLTVASHYTRVCFDFQYKVHYEFEITDLGGAPKNGTMQEYLFAVFSLMSERTKISCACKCNQHQETDSFCCNATCSRRRTVT